MPELPEVETIARTLSPLVRGRRIRTVEVRHPGSVDSGSLPLSLLQGRCIADTGRRGKLALLHLVPTESDAFPSSSVLGEHCTTHCTELLPNEPAFIAVHLKMTGRLFVYGPQQQPGPHTRLILDMEDEAGALSRLFFDDARKFGYARLLSSAALARWPFWQSLGPEPLEQSAEALMEGLWGRGGGIKSLLLNQKVVAGIGNIYADEALFRAGVDPRAKVSSLSRGRLTRLFVEVQTVLRESIEQCGSSIRDYRTARGDAGAFQNAFRVYGRAGKACVTCGTMLAAATVAGRTTVFCPQCQKE